MNNWNLIVLLPLALAASGCQPREETTRAGEVDAMPLLVRFEEQPSGDKIRWCPMDVIQMVESCPMAKAARDKVCRGKGRKIDWVSVTGDSPPYKRNPGLPEFDIKFNGDSPLKPKDCRQSKGGAVECKIDPNAKQGEYKYDVVAGDCSLDPRIYVE